MKNLKMHYFSILEENLSPVQKGVCQRPHPVVAAVAEAAAGVEVEPAVGAAAAFPAPGL